MAIKVLFFKNEQFVPLTVRTLTYYQNEHKTFVHKVILYKAKTDCKMLKIFCFFIYFMLNQTNEDELSK